MNADVLYDDFEYLYAKDVDWKKLNGKTVLVTGGTGLIGSLLLKYMYFLNQKKNFNISLFSIVRDVEKAASVLGDIEVNYIKADLTEECVIEEKIDYIFHCAAITKSKEMVEHPVRVFDSIVTATNHVLQFASKKNVQSMVYLSSMEVYGRTDETLELVTEDVMGYVNPLSCRSCYPLGKRMAENLCYNYYIGYSKGVKR